MCTTVLVRYKTMRLHIDGIESRVEDGSFPRHQALPRVRALAGVQSATPEAVGRAIEDLGRSGYRPLRPSPMASDPASMKDAWGGGADRSWPACWRSEVTSSWVSSAAPSTGFWVSLATVIVACVGAAGGIAVQRAMWASVA
jgi:hypothetical protein